MTRVGVHEAKTNLSELLRRVAAGEEVTITSGGQPVALLIPAPRANGPRTLGRDRDSFTVPEDFDAPLDDEVLRTFEG
jgi:prevent-host-death family protein